MGVACVRRCWFLAVAAGVFFAAAVAPAKARAERPVTILDGSGAWRALYSWNAPLLQASEGLEQRRSKSARAGPTERPEFRFLTAYAAEGWAEADFDDSAWPRRNFCVKYANGERDDRAGGGAASAYLRQLALRGKFTVTDPAKVQRLWLSMAYRGGAVAYVNGKEFYRSHLPAGKVEPGAPAEIYSEKAYLRGPGKPWHWWNDREAIAQQAYPLRVRRWEKIPVPPDLLCKGINVLAVEIHAAPYPEAFRKAAPEWATCGLVELHLQADQPEGIMPNATRPAGLQVWNTRTCEQVYDIGWADPHEPLRPVGLAGPRNGVCSGRVVVGSDQPLRHLRASVTELTGPGGMALPAQAAKVWYGKFDVQRGSRWGGSNDGSFIQWGAMPRLREDALLESPPAEIPCSTVEMPRGLTESRLSDGLPPKPAGGAVQSVWLLVEIPRDARPGQYRGTLSIAADGHAPVQVPLVLQVIDWTLPSPSQYTYWLGMIQSPEAVALTYRVPPWSEEHCRLVAKSFQWIGKLGGKVLYIPLGAESQYGNAESMVVWIKQPDGKYTYDFSRVERYVDLALKHLGKPRVVVVGVWDSCSHVSSPVSLKRGFPRFSVRQAATGQVTTADGPRHGTTESREFWRPVLKGVQNILAARGLAEAMLLGYCADRLPDEATVGVFHDILPGVGWQATRHSPRGEEWLRCAGGSVPVRYQVNVWGGWENHDPEVRRVHGWQYPIDPSLRTWLDRSLFDASSLAEFRTACEQALLAERHGLGQIGADFWPVPGPDGKPAGTMVGRFPATSEGNLGIYSGQLLYAGPDGPVPSVRYQLIRENMQECEARIFLEKLLLQEPSPLPAELAERIQQVLDERTRWHRLLMMEAAPESAISWPYSGCEARAVRLFEAAADAARATTKP